MCNTVVVVEPGRVLFAKNSDRDANEAQLLSWQPAHEFKRGSKLKTTWLEIPQVERTNAVLLSRPFWMWGAEIGANEHGVVIGNEAVFTTQPMKDGSLLGMDLLRLALERANSAAAAVDVICDLLGHFGQGGVCSLENPKFRYHNSFIVADASGAFIIDTADKEVATERVEGVRSISNALSIPTFSKKHNRALETWACSSQKRRARTTELGEKIRTPADMMTLLGDHGAENDQPSYSWFNGTLDAPYMHNGGLVASSV
ncbi:hypothetical protein JYT22_01300, partial [Endomicrobium sp. AH-315-J14]|nr:hypothetical protein [Endomicrobium sp. AH-315-J14]